ncbi:MAG TPA: hypothetical protein VF210_05055 [Pseudomonadales bacterium]
MIHRSSIRLANRLAAALTALLLGGCAGLPEGLPRAADDEPGSALFTLPSGRTVTVRPEALTYTGEGAIVWPDGRTYRGDWVNGRPHGEGEETQPDGTAYRGGWKDGNRHGHGEIVFADGDRYVGEFAGGVREGRGTLESHEGVYRGDWSDDLPSGHGVFEARDGARYEGEWLGGQRFGYGRYRTADGGSYEGEWAHDQPHGFGTLQDPDGASHHGAWQAGRPHGYGRAEGPPGLVYEGTWVDGVRDGFGRETRPDGTRYEGYWRAGQRDGQGLEMRPDGSFHDGQWELDRPLGPGLRRAATGIEISGNWNGDVVSTGLVKLPSGAEYAGPLFRGPRAMAPRLLEWLHRVGGIGDPYAALMLGTAYLDFDEPAPDPERARHWLERSAAAGIAEAQFRLALIWENVHPPRVVELLAEAARQGHALANATLGEYYYGGITVPRNLARAIGYFQRAVDAGSITARNNLAWLLATADDPAHRDGTRAVSLIRPIALYEGAWQYLDTLAAAWAASGAFDKAVDTAERAIEAARREPAAAESGELEAMQRRLAGYRSGVAHVEWVGAPTGPADSRPEGAPTGGAETPR